MIPYRKVSTLNKDETKIFFSIEDSIHAMNYKTPGSSEKSKGGVETKLQRKDIDDAPNRRRF